LTRGVVDFRFSPQANNAHLILWQAWGDAALTHAREQDKLVLLSVSPVWSLWSRRLDETTFSDQRVIAYLNDHLVPVRVDPDERPDLNRRYNTGAFPSVTVLEPGGRALAGGAFFTADSLLAFLRETDQAFRKNRERVLQNLERVPDAPALADSSTLDWLAVSDHIFMAVRDTFDPDHGGFDQNIKYPRPEIISFLLKRYIQTRDARVEEMIVQTLGRMQSGAIHDRVDGGFFRCATAPDWGAPLPEKLLVTNVDLLICYWEAYQVIKHPGFAETARGIQRFLLERLYNPQEGLFRNAAYMDTVVAPAAAAGRGIDHTLRADWNSRAARALLLASAMTGEDTLCATAMRVMETLERVCYDSTLGLYAHTAVAGQPGPQFFLGDQEAMLGALLDQYAITGNDTCAARATALARRIRKHFYDPVSGGFFDCRPIPENANLRPDQLMADNCRLAPSFLQLDFIADDNEFRPWVDGLTSLCGQQYRQYGKYAAVFGDLLERLAAPKVECFFIIHPDDKETRRLTRAFKAHYLPGALVRCYSSSDKVIRRGALKFYPVLRSAAHISIRSRIWGPLETPGQVDELLHKAGM
jgi:uncharacterized protein YyaL (SSP411 family)